MIAHTLKGEGFDASEDGTGRGTPIVPVCVHSDAIGRDGSALTPSPDAEGRIRLRDAGMGVLSDGTSYNLTTGQPHAICFSSKDHGADAMLDLSPTLRAGGHSKSHANAGVMPAIAFNMHKSGNEASSLGVSTDRTDCLRAFEKSPFAVMRPASAVRRLTPRECERLQGFSDDFTLVPHRGKPAADGPRYKALGNSMAVPVMRWIGERIQAVEALTNTQAANDTGTVERAA